MFYKKIGGKSGCLCNPFCKLNGYILCAGLAQCHFSMLAATSLSVLKKNHFREWMKPTLSIAFIAEDVFSALDS